MRRSSVANRGARWAGALAWAALLALAATFVATGESTAAASFPPLLWQAPEDGNSGTGAGRLDNVEGVAADPSTGHIFLSDWNNSRVMEFDAWGVFVKGWGWGVADGSPEAQTCGPGATPPSETCLKGLSGSGAGQFNQPRGGIAVDAAGDVYVGDMKNRRVQKFDSEGGFLLSFGEAGSGPGQFETGQFGTYLATSPAGSVYVGDKDRVQEFEPNGAFKAEIPFEGALEELDGKDVQSLAVDAAGNLYLAAAGVEAVLKVSPSGALLKSFAMERPRNIALDADGNLYATRFFQEVVEFAPDGSPIIAPGEGFAALGLAIKGLATNVVSPEGEVELYLAASNGTTTSYARSYGPPPLKWLPPPARAPEITRQYAISIAPEAAELQARINPRFWELPVAPTTFHLEYGTGRCSEGGCTQTTAETPLGAGFISRPAPTPTVALPGLVPATTYHYRFVAQSGGGGPVRGVGGEVGADGAEGTFTTPALPPGAGADGCANAQLRTGFSAPLADCRAYEMVSPVDKEGGDVITLVNIGANPAALDQGAEAGGGLTYSTYRASGEVASAPYTSQYLATRGGGGWASRGISPPRGVNILPSGDTLESEFRAFSPDLCTGWLVHDTDPPLAPGAVPGFANLYSDGLCGGGYEAVTTVKPPNRQPKEADLEMQGRSADGSVAVYRADDKLTPNAPTVPNATYLAYASRGGEQRLVCVLPGGAAVGSGGCSAGTAYDKPDNRSDWVANAVSEDGTRIYWTAATEDLGAIYLRLNPFGAGAECGKATAPCTLAVSAAGEAMTGGLAVRSRFWGAAADGSRAIFATSNAVGASDLYEYDLATEATQLIAHESPGVVGMSEDASRLYFVSREDLAAGAVGGAPNLYLREDGEAEPRLVAILGEADIGESGNDLSPVSSQPNRHLSRVSPDGEHVAFMSTGSPTGFDSTDAGSGEPDAEVYRYDAAADGGKGRLICASCNPTGAAPSGRELKVGTSSTGLWAAAQIPAAENQLYFPRALSADGSRLYFESFEPLVVRDTNEMQDVYQWEAPGRGTCTTAAPSYSPPNGGCLSLISSGKSPQDSSFIDASADGTDVFFSTGSSLLPQDPGLIDIYDARELGGFPPPQAPTPPCQGEACQSPGPAPNDPTPASSAYHGPGNLKPARNCPKGKRKVKRKGKVRCVRKHRKRKHAHHKRRHGKKHKHNKGKRHAAKRGGQRR